MPLPSKFSTHQGVGLPFSILLGFLTDTCPSGAPSERYLSIRAEHSSLAMSLVTSTCTRSPSFGASDERSTECSGKAIVPLLQAGSAEAARKANSLLIAICFIRLHPHWHQHIKCTRFVIFLDECRRRRIGQMHFHSIAIDLRKNVHQIAGVKPNLKTVGTIFA